MNTVFSTSRKFTRMLGNILSIFVVLAVAFPTMGNVSAQENSPGLRAFPDQEFVDGWFWPVGEPVDLTINNESFGFQTADENGTVEFPLTDYDLKRGDTLTLANGDISVTHIVRQLFVVNIDLNTQTMSGTVDGGQQTVHVWTGEAELYVETDGSGNWFADFSGFDGVLFPGACGNAEAWEGPGSTIIDWCVPAPPSNPHFTVFPEWEFFDGLAWPDGAMVTITVAGKPECEIMKESWDGFFNGNFGEGCDVVIGDTVTFTDGQTVRTHTVQNLDVTHVEIRGDTVYGTGDTGAVVHVWPHDFGDAEVVVTAEDGKWMAEFSRSGFDLVEGMCGRSEIRDEVGNATAVDWCYPVPHFTVFPEWDYIEGSDWHPNDYVYLTIEPESSEDPVTFYTQARTELPSWDPNRWWVFFDLKDQFDLKAGDTVYLDDDSVTRTMSVRNLSVMNVDPIANVISGTATPGAEVQVWPHETGQQLSTVAGASGTWLVDFTGTFDLVPGTCGRAQILDAFDNATAVDWCAPKPWLIAFPENDAAEGWEWPVGKTVTLTINNAPEGFYREGTAEVTTWGDPRTYVRFDFGGEDGYDLKIGDQLTLTGEDGTVRTHIVQNLAVTKVNQEDDTVKGVGSAGAEVHVWPHATGQEQMVTANPKGKWDVDFTGVYDLMRGDGGRAEIRDEMGNATAVDWYIPNSRIVASITEDWFYVQEFRPDTIVDFTVYEAQDGKPIWKGTATTDGSGFAWINAEGRWDLEPGNYVDVKDGSSSKDLVIEGFTFDVFDLTQGLLQGAAPGPEGRRVWVGIGWENDGWSMDVTTDGTGAWLADFGTPVPNDYQWVAAQIFDNDGDASELRPARVVDLWVAAYTYDYGNWSEGEHNYHFEAEWNGGSETTNDVSFSVSSEAQSYDGYALLRPGAVRAGAGCEGIDAIDPNQSTRFLAGYVTDYAMTYEEALAYFDSLTASAVWDDGQSAQLARHEIISFREDNWFDYVCTFTAALILDASQPDWVDSGITVSAGQAFRIEAFGLMNPCSDTYPNGADYCIFFTPPGAEGVVPYENEFGIFPGPGLRFMALLGRIGEGEPFYVGAGGTFTAEQAGTLWFTPNDNLRTDNQGAYRVLVWLEP